MEFHSAHRVLHPSHLGGSEEKQQMLSLNRRLESYLNRVKLLEEENAQLTKEIQAARQRGQGAHSLRRGLEEELRRARLAVDAAWRDRFATEMEVGKLAEELRELDGQRQREAQAKVRAKTKLEQSRKELEEEHRAQMWLRERAGQLEHEMRLLLQNHQEDVALFEAKLSHSRASAPRAPPQRGNQNQNPDLLELGQEYSQRAARAWQEAAEAYQGQMARLEESLAQAGGRLAQVGQEKRQSQLKLQALEQEMASAQDVRRHLEKTAAQQRDVHGQEIQQLQEHLEGLEAERGELGQQIEQLLLENRGLLQLKMSLGLEVATYRALLDGEGFRGDVPLNRRKNVSIPDAVFSSRGVKRDYPTQLSAHPRTSSSSSFSSVRRKTEPTTSTPISSRKPAASDETPKISARPADATKPAAQETPRLMTPQGGAVESLVPQEIQEKVAESLPEQEAVEREKEEPWDNVEPPEETPFVEAVKHQVEFSLSSEPSLNNEAAHDQFKTPSLAPSDLKTTEESYGFSESDTNMAFGGATAEKRRQAPIEAWVKEERGHNEAANDEEEEEEESDSETEAMLEPTWESRPSSPESSSETEDIVTEFNLDDIISKEDAVETNLEVKSSAVGTSPRDAEDKLYPDGEEMDTWDSVIERKVDLTMSGAAKTDEGKGQHAEPEEDISVKEPEGKKKESTQEVVSDGKQVDNMVPSQMVTKQVGDEKQTVLEGEAILLPDKDEDEDEDSQNVSVSWRTELEGDSYAQDNTLADTRPLIRYKSDETDANTLASHADESESSEGELDRKAGETGTGAWGQDKSKRFGTMEDLCEEVEGGIMDEEYNLDYAQTGHTGGGSGPAEGEQRVHEKEPNQEHSHEETEKPVKATHGEDDEDLETDRFVDQKSENLTTESSSALPAEQPVSEEMDEPLKENMKPEEAGQTKVDDLCVENVKQDLITSTTVTRQMSEKPFSADSFVVMSQMDTMAQWDILHGDQEAVDLPEKIKEDEEHDVSTAKEADPTEVHPIVSRSEEANISAEEENGTDVSEDTEVEEAEDTDASEPSQKDEDAADSQEVYGDRQLPQVADLKGASEESPEQKEKDVVDLWDSLRRPQPDDAGETFKEPHDSLLEGVVQSQELSGSLQNTQSIEEPEEQPVEGVVEGQDLSACLEQPQLEAVMEVSKEPQEQVEGVADNQELSSKQEQPQSEDPLKASEETQDRLETADIHDLFSSLQHTRSGSPTQAAEEAPEQPVDDAAPCQELPGSLQPPQLDDGVETPKENLEELVEPPPSLTEASKKSQEEEIKDIARSQELSGDLEQPQHDVPLETFEGFQEHRTEDVAEFPEAPESAEWEVLENPGEEFEIQDQSDQKGDVVVGSPDEGGENPPEVSPDSAPGRHDIFAMQDATDGGLGGFFPPGVKNDFWVSSLGGGATFQPENEAAEQTNQNVAFADNAVWGVSDQQNVFNGKSRTDAGPLEAPAAKKDQKQLQAEVKQAVCRKVVEGELVHSEESEVEGESWSSEE